MDVKNLIVGGDTHGDKKQISYFYHCAKVEGADAIFVVGDFGYWEHEESGIKFLNFIERQAQATGIPLFWLDGNHENHQMLRANYGKLQTADGFWVIRDGCYYAPRGHRWTWGDRSCMSLGGAYSTDKDYRLARERGGSTERWGIFSDEEPTGPLTQWWPEEQLTDAEVARAISDPARLDVLFTHDRPRGTNIGDQFDRKTQPESLINQDRVSVVMKALRPNLLIHGHLHIRYTDQIRSGGDSWTTVIGLGSERSAPKTDSWIELHLGHAKVSENDTREALAG